MLSLAYMMTVLFAVVAVSQGDVKSNVLSKKWLDAWNSYSSSFSASSYYSGAYLGMNSWLSNSWSNYYGSSSSIYGYNFIPGGYNSFLFAKLSGKESVSRRAISLDAEQLHRRASEDSVSCVNEKGVSHEFLKSDCLKAAPKLSDKKLSSASCGRCTLSLVTPEGRVAPKAVPGSAFTASVDGILKACSARHHAGRDTTSGHTKDRKNDLALVLSSSEKSIAC